MIDFGNVHSVDDPGIEECESGTRYYCLNIMSNISEAMKLFPTKMRKTYAVLDQFSFVMILLVVLGCVTFSDITQQFITVRWALLVNDTINKNSNLNLLLDGCEFEEILSKYLDFNNEEMIAETYGENFYTIMMRTLSNLHTILPSPPKQSSKRKRETSDKQTQRSSGGAKSKKKRTKKIKINKRSKRSNKINKRSKKRSLK